MRQRSDNRAGQPVRLPGTGGFTLVELLVVLFIIGLVAGLATLTLPDPRGALVREAERFAARAIAARDDAVLQSRPVALRVNAAGYGFEERRNGAWQGIDEGPLALATWPSGTVASQDGGAAAGERLVFDPVGLASTDLRLVLVRGGDRVTVSIQRNGAVRVQ